MKKIQNFKTFNEQKLNDEQLNEGFKNWILGSLIALSSFAVSGQDIDNSVTTNTGHKYEITNKNDISIVKGFIKYQKQILQQKGTISKVKDGKFTTIKGQGFSGGSSLGSGYSKGNAFFAFGSEKDPTAQINVSLKDDGTISIMFGEGHHAHYTSTGLDLTISNSQTLSQTEVHKGEPGYKEALELLELCGISTQFLK